MSMGKCIKNLSSRNDNVLEKASAVTWRGELTSEVDKKNTSAKENISKGSDSKSSSGMDSHVEKNMKHHQKEAWTKESKISTHHKKSSKSQTSKKYVTNNSTESNSIEARLPTYKTKEASPKHISYDPYLGISEGYNPKYPDLFPGSKSIKKERDTCEPDQFHSSKSIKRESGTYEPSVKRKLEVQTETICESKPKKLKTVSKSDQISEKKDKHKKHGAQGSQLEKRQSLNQKKENSGESLDDYSKEKSSDKSNSSKCTARESDKNKKSSKKAKIKINSTVEFTSSEANFEDCLGLNDIVIKKKKNPKPIQTSAKTDNTAQPKVTAVNYKHSSSHVFPPASPKKSSTSQKEKLHVSVHKPKITKVEDVNIMSTLPQTLPNYRPLPRVESYPKKKEVLSNDDAILYMSSKREKTAVYSGRRSYYTEVPSLFEICSRVVIDNIDYVEYLGNVPYDVLKPILEKCNPQQLLHIENYNPYLLEDTDELWEIHCKRNCKLLKLEENETYRELYLRAQDEREKKLKSITANISASMSKYNPARQVKLAYIDAVVKPPRDVARKQAKNGTATPLSHPVKAGLPLKENPKPVPPAVNPVKVGLPLKENPKPVPSPVNSSSSVPPVPNHVIKTKPKVAPLMAKTLKSMKQCFRR